MDPRHTMTGPHRFLMEWTRETPRGPRTTCVGPAGPAQGPHGPAPLMASPPRKQYILPLEPQRTCAGPAWTHVHYKGLCPTRPTLDPLDSRPSLSLLLGPAWTRATQLGHIASRWTRKELCGAAWPAPRKQHDFFELQGTRAGCVPHPSNTG